MFWGGESNGREWEMKGCGLALFQVLRVEVRGRRTTEERED